MSDFVINNNYLYIVSYYVDYLYFKTWQKYNLVKKTYLFIYEQFVRTNTVEIIPLDVNIKYIIV